MNDASFDLTPATIDDITVVEELLAENDLPADDVAEKIECIFLAKNDTDLIGIGGMELHGRYGLLRSLVTAPKFRGGGYGKIITLKLIDHAVESGVAAVYLLTTTASEFFEKLGFSVIDRAVVPTPIAKTSEFKELCPESAVCLRLELSPKK